MLLERCIKYHIFINFYCKNAQKTKCCTSRNCWGDYAIQTSNGKDSILEGSCRLTNCQKTKSHQGKVDLQLSKNQHKQWF